jgi:hypothetical protein
MKLTKKQRKKLENIVVLAEKALTDSRAARRSLKEVRKNIPIDSSFDLLSEMLEQAKHFKSKPRKIRAVYFLKSKGFIKIGHTANIKKRIGSLQGFNPSGLELLGWVPEDRFSEKQLHDKFKKYKHHLEWFTISPEILEFINTFCSTEKPSL